MNAGDVIRKARENLKLTQAEFASLTGHVQATVSKWESGTWSPDPWDIELCAALAQSTLRDASRVLARKGPIYCLRRALVRIPSL